MAEIDVIHFAFFFSFAWYVLIVTKEIHSILYVRGPCNPYITRRESHTITRDWENTQFVMLDVPIWAFSRMLWYFRCAILYPDWSATVCVSFLSRESHTHTIGFSYACKIIGREYDH